MSAEVLLARWAGPARRRARAEAALSGAPAVMLAAAIGWRAAGVGAALVVAVAGLAVLAWWTRRAVRGRDGRWTVRRLDARRADMEDSAALLLADPAGLSPVARLQRARLEARLAHGEPEALLDGWRWTRIAWLWAGATLAAVALWAWPTRDETPPPLTPVADGPVVAGVPRLVAQRLRIVPPAYTGQPPRYATGLDVRAPAGSRIEWVLRFAPAPGRAAIEVDGGSRVALARRGAEWTAAWRLDRSLLYRVRPDTEGRGAVPPLHRLEAIADRPPGVRLIAPAGGLAVATPGQRRWAVTWEARDDHGVAPVADVRLTIAEGEGEQVSFRERRLRVSGSDNGGGGGRVRRFTVAIDLAAIGLSPGSDLVVEPEVVDNRPSPQRVRGPAAILRRAGERAGAVSGLEAVTRRVLPAYLRSQRQIIIDAEALIAQRRRLPPTGFVAKSEALGLDQRLLRLRYGQFLGEEAGGGARPALPTADADTPVEPEHHDGDGHDHGASDAGGAAAGFGREGDVLAEFGHTHDEAEAATLIDPDTRALLKQALDAMWQSELHLRQGDPQAALAPANVALRFIKQVQQATRIFLARVGPQLPPIDQGRRMTGKRDGLASRPLKPTPYDAGDGMPAAAWRMLAGPGGGRAAPDLDALDRWARGAARLRDPLAMRAAIDRVRQEPGCAPCRERLRALIWNALPRPPAAVRRRGDGGAVGRAYLDAVR